MQELKKSYKKISAPDFHPALLLEDFIIYQAKHERLKERILAQNNFMIRRETIEKLYAFAQNKENFPTEKKWIRFLGLHNTQEKSLALLQKLYMDTVAEQVHSSRYTTLRDKYIAYRWILITAFKSHVTNEDYLKWLALLQFILDQPITASSVISLDLLRGS
jgi:hypothetical protein